MTILVTQFDFVRVVFKKPVSQPQLEHNTSNTSIMITRLLLHGACAITKLPLF